MVRRAGCAPSATRSRPRQIGYDAADWAGKPVSGVINTWSGINACHAHLRSRSEEAARRRAAWVAPTHIDQADDGCDFDFLEHGAAVPKPEIH